MAARVRSIFAKNLFENRVAIVTGGGSGIGKAIAQELIHLGCKVVIASRKLNRLERAVEDLNRVQDEGSKGSVVAMTCDIRKEKEVETLFSSTLSQFGKVDFVVNNGGGQFMQPVAQMKLKGWNAVIETNLTGTFLMSVHAYHSWMKENGGSIVNIIADMWQGFPLMGHTGAARAAVDNLTKTLSVEWAENGIRINAVAPGIIYSEGAVANYGEDVVARAAGGNPTKRLGRPEEVSAAVCFLLSPAAAFISGATLRVDGGGSVYSPHRYNIADHNRLPPFQWKSTTQ